MGRRGGYGQSPDSRTIWPGHASATGSNRSMDGSRRRGIKQPARRCRPAAGAGSIQNQGQACITVPVCRRENPAAYASPVDIPRDVSPRSMRKKLTAIFTRLLDSYGSQHWWPGQTAFEVMVGAVLTQNTAWTNVERAIANLKAAGALDPQSIVTASPHQLANWLRPSGYFNVKAKRLRAFCEWLLARGGRRRLIHVPTLALRHDLLGVHGIGPETADDILLYAFSRPVFVIDAYTRRLFSRLGLISGRESYEDLRRLFERSLRPDAAMFNEYHALVVHHAKLVCRPQPRCDQCALSRQCPSANSLRRQVKRGTSIRRPAGRSAS